MNATKARKPGTNGDGRGIGIMFGLTLVLAVAVAAWMFADDLAAMAMTHVSQADWSLGSAYQWLGDLILSGARWLLAQAEAADKGTVGGLLWFLVCGLVLVIYAIVALVVMLILAVLLLILALILSVFDPISFADVTSGATLVTVRVLAVGLGISGVISALSAWAGTDRTSTPAPRSESAAPISGRVDLSSGAVPAASTVQRTGVPSPQGGTSTDAESWQALDERVDALENLGWAAGRSVRVHRMRSASRSGLGLKGTMRSLLA